MAILRGAAVVGLGWILAVADAQGAPDRELPPDMGPRPRGSEAGPPGAAGSPHRGGAASPRARASGARKGLARARRTLLTNRGGQPGSTTSGAGRPASPTAAPGAYHGVVPGLPQRVRTHLPPDHRRRCYLTWTGFQLLPNGSRLFLQLNRKPSFRARTRGSSLTITLWGCRVASWNNTRPLFTRYFPTPVRYARVRLRRRAVVMTVLLKKPARARLRVVHMQGWYYLFVTYRHTRSAWAPSSPGNRRTRRSTSREGRGGQRSPGGLRRAGAGRGERRSHSGRRGPTP